MSEKKTNWDRAHRYATRRAATKAPKEWSKDERGTYWWGLFEGYTAGRKAARKAK